MTRWFLILLSGCSMALSGPSPDRPRNKPPQCDTSKGMVVVDSLIAGTLGIVAVSVASSNGGAAVLPLIGGGIFAASAIHGNTVVNACSRENANYDAEMAAAALNPDVEPQRPVVAMQAAVALPPRAIAPQPPLAQPQPQPQPPQQQQPPQQPQLAQPHAEPSASEPWASFWKESP